MENFEFLQSAVEHQHRQMQVSSVVEASRRAAELAVSQLREKEVQAMAAEGAQARDEAIQVVNALMGAGVAHDFEIYKQVEVGERRRGIPFLSSRAVPIMASRRVAIGWEINRYESTREVYMHDGYPDAKVRWTCVTGLLENGHTISFDLAKMDSYRKVKGTLNETDVDVHTWGNLEHTRDKLAALLIKKGLA